MNLLWLNLRQKHTVGAEYERKRKRNEKQN